MCIIPAITPDSPDARLSLVIPPTCDLNSHEMDINSPGPRVSSKTRPFFFFRGSTCESLSPARTAEHFPPSTACQGHQPLKGTPNPDNYRCILMPCTCFCLYLTARFARVGACEVSEGRIQRGEDEGMRDSVQFVPQRADNSRNNSNKELKSTQRER